MAALGGEKESADYWLQQREGRSVQIIGCSGGVYRSLAAAEGGEESEDYWLQQRERGEVCKSLAAAGGKKSADYWLQQRSLQINGCSGGRGGVCRSLAAAEGGEESSGHLLQ